MKKLKVTGCHANENNCWNLKVENH